MTEGKGGVAGEKSTNQAMDTHFVGLKKESKTNRNRVGLGEVTRREGKEKGGGQHNTHCSSLILHFFFFFSSFFYFSFCFFSFLHIKARLRSSKAFGLTLAGGGRGCPLRVDRRACLCRTLYTQRVNPPGLPPPPPPALPQPATQRAGPKKKLSFCVVSCMI